MNKPDDFRLEEYRNISGAILDLDRRIVTIYGATLVATGSLLSWASPPLLVTTQSEQASPIASACIVLFAMLLMPAAFQVQLAFRRELIGMGMYRWIFFEEGESTGLSWETALNAARAAARSAAVASGVAPRREANDPIPIVYWVIFFAGASLFCRGLSLSGVSFAWGLALLVPFGWLGHVHQQWDDVVAHDVQRKAREWREAKAAIAREAPLC